MRASVTRRRFVQGSAAAAAAAALEPTALAAEAGRFAQRPDGPNVLLVIVDSLRADAIYDDWVRTPNITELARQGIRFTHVFPEGMPTVPVRNAILSGRRQFPYRGWYDRRGLIQMPGWEPLDRPDASFLAVLRRAGYRTAFVTDNPFLGFARPYEPLRQSFDRFVRRGGQVGGRATGVSERELRHWIPDWLAEHPELRLTIEGHTDNAGSKDYNLKLGLDRAENVKRYLYENHQVPLHKINVISYGEEKPIAPNKSRDGRAQNRRVVIRVLA
jgi:hypothetical protein